MLQLIMTKYTFNIRKQALYVFLPPWSSQLLFPVMSLGDAINGLSGGAKM